MRLIEKIKRLERKLSIRSIYPNDEDGFLSALGVDAKRFEKTGGGYDFIAALNATAAEDWNEE